MPANTFKQFLFVMVLISAGSFLNADDNVIGMPKPRDATHPGAVVLHGGGRLSSEVFNRFVELAGGREARIVLVPSAGYDPRGYNSEADFRRVISSRFSDWVRLATTKQIRSFQFLYTDNPHDADDAKFVKPLESATGVWFSGGAQGRLNYRFVGEFPRQTRFQNALREVLCRGGVVGGTSAGTAIQPEIITLYDHHNAGSPAIADTAHGFGLFNQAIVEQHFDARGGRLERFTGLLRDEQRLDQLAGREGAGAKMIGLAVEERTALVVQGDRLSVLGSNNVHVFLKSDGGRSVLWQQLAPGDEAELKLDADKSPVLKRK